MLIPYSTTLEFKIYFGLGASGIQDELAFIDFLPRELRKENKKERTYTAVATD